MSFNRVAVHNFTNISATATVDDGGTSFRLRGGNYAMTIKATWGGGSVTLQRKALDGTYVTVTPAFVADSFIAMNLPSGDYRLLVATATAIYAELISTVVTL